jgi:hypothetical protein
VDDDHARLMRWRFADGIPEDSYPAVMAHSRFPEAGRALATNMLAAAGADRALDGIFKDAGRYVAAMTAVWLHLSGGLTLPRLKEAGAATGFLSAGRARDLLLFLQHLDFIAQVKPPLGGAPALYEPTPTLMAAWRGHLTAALEAACLVEPAGRLVLARLGEAEVLAAFARAHAETLAEAASRSINQGSAYQRVFMHRHAGNQIVWTLLTSGDGEPFPPEGPLQVSASAAARRFAVSRIHIKRMLDDAVREGLLGPGPAGAVVLQAGAREEIRWLYAAQLVHLLVAAARALEAAPP